MSEPDPPADPAPSDEPEGRVGPAGEHRVRRRVRKWLRRIGVGVVALVLLVTS